MNPTIDPHSESVERSPPLIPIQSHLNESRYWSTYWYSGTKSDTDPHSESVERSPPLIPVLSQMNPAIDLHSESVEQSPPLVSLLRQWIQSATDPYFEPIESSP
jgi:hypothetical protein